MNKDVITKSIPIINSGKYGYTNYYISKETLLKKDLAADLLGSALIYEDKNHKQRIIGYFSPLEMLNYETKDDKLYVTSNATMFRNFEGPLISRIRSGEVSFTPEIELIETHDGENGLKEIDDFKLLFVLAYDTELDNE